MTTAVQTRLSSGLANITGGRGPHLALIENPSLENKLGILLANHFYGPPLNRFKDVHYIRLDTKSGAVVERLDFHEARIHICEHPTTYRFITTKTHPEKILQAGSEIPYEICSINKKDFEMLTEDSIWKHLSAEALEEVYKLLAMNSRLFKYNEREFNLPKNYAAVRLST